MVDRNVRTSKSTRSELESTKKIKQSEMTSLLTTQYQFKTLKNIDLIGRTALNSIADDGFFTYEYFKTLETTKSSPFKPFYLVICNKDKVEAIAPYLIEPFNNKQTSRLGRIIKISDTLGFLSNRQLNCHSPNSFHSQILLKEKASTKNYLDIFLKKIDDLCKIQRIPFSCFPYVSEFDKALISNLQDFGYLNHHFLKTWYLDIQWSEFDEYLGGFNHKTRNIIKREIKNCQDSGVTVSEEKDFEALSEKLSTLYSNLFSKYTSDAKSPYDPLFFQMLSEHAKDKTKVFIAQKADTLVGFSLSLQHKETLDVYFCGFDYASLGKTDFVYFNLVYYEPIKLAIQRRLKRIHFRIGSEKAKIERGCKSEKTYYFLKCQDSLLKGLINFYLKKVK